ncbi:MAG: peptide ABC transporter substrate-binding protein [Chloroflexota bacterium]
MHKVSKTLVLCVVLILVLTSCQQGEGVTTAPATPEGREAITTTPIDEEGGTTDRASTAMPDPESATAESAVAKAAPGVLRVALPYEPGTVDPQQASYSDEIAIAMLNYQPLMRFNLDMQPVPGAAERVDVSDDGLVYTFTLHEESQYADGAPLTAADFAYAWKRLADPTLAGPYQSIGCGVIAGYQDYAVTSCPDADGVVRDSTDLDDLDLDALRETVGVVALDDRTLEITLEQPTPWFLSLAALWIGAPVRQQDVESGETWWSNPETYVGNGPFELQEWHAGQMTWVANPSWPLGPLQLEQIEMTVIDDSQVAFQAYQNGELDVLEVIGEDWVAVEQDEALLSQVVLDAPQTSNYLAFNLAQEPFNNVLVRQAFAQAIDRGVFVTDILGGIGIPSSTLIPPSIPGYVEDQGWSFDPDAARAALAEAGYPNGEGLPESVFPFSSSPRTQNQYEWLASQLQEHLNITVRLDPLDSTAYIELISNPETFPQLAISGWNPDYPDPQNYYSQVFATGGYEASIIGYTSEEFDKLIAAADRENDPDQRADLYDQAQDVLNTDIPVTFLWYSQDRILVQPHVQGITEDVVTPLDIDGVPGFYALQTIAVTASE